MCGGGREDLVELPLLPEAGTRETPLGCAGACDLGCAGACDHGMRLGSRDLKAGSAQHRSHEPQQSPRCRDCLSEGRVGGCPTHSSDPVNHHSNNHHLNRLQAAEENLAELANLRNHVDALRQPPSATMERCIWKYLKGREEDITRYVEGFHLDLEQGERRLTRLARLHLKTKHKSDDKSGNNKKVAQGG